MMLNVLVALLFAAIIAAASAHALAQPTPWRLGAPELVWRFQPSSEGVRLGTLAVHPDGGVVAVAEERADRVTLLRVAASGSLLWQHTSVVRQSEKYAHLAFLRRDEGVDTIVASSGSLTVLGPAGAKRWTRSAAEIGIRGMGVAIARRTPAGDFIVIGGEGFDDRRQSVAMAAALTADGVRRWLAVGPWPADIAPPRILEEDLGPYEWEAEQLPTAALPLRILDDGGAVVLVGCGHMGAQLYYLMGRLPEMPCAPRSAMPLVAIDGSGRTGSIVVAGTAPSPAQSGAWNLPPAVAVDAFLEPRALRWDGPPWDARELPYFLPSVWWLGPSTPAIVQFLRRAVYPRGRYDPEPHLFVVYNGERPARRLPSLATFPAADVIVDGDVAYLLLAPAEWHGPRLVTLLAVRRGGAAVLAARATPAFQRVRYAPHESAIYALQGHDVVRMRVIRRPG